MYTYTTKNLPKHTKEFLVEIAWDTIVAKREQTFDEMALKVTAPGFRQGKAPREVVAKFIEPQKVYEQVVRKLLPDIYRDLIDKEKLRPVTNPSVELTEAKDDAPWKLSIQIAEIPEVKLKDYKSKISEVHHKSHEHSHSHEEDQPTKSSPKKKKEKDTTTEQSEHDHKTTPLSDIFTALLTHTECEIPDLLVQEEVNNKLSRLVDDVRKVGLTLDKYLESRQSTLDTLKAQFSKESEEMYKIEFVLAKIAEDEKIIVTQKEMDDILLGAKTDKEKEVAKANLSWYEALLRKQKVIDFLNGL